MYPHKRAPGFVKPIQRAVENSVWASWGRRDWPMTAGGCPGGRDPGTLEWAKPTGGLSLRTGVGLTHDRATQSTPVGTPAAKPGAVPRPLAGSGRVSAGRYTCLSRRTLGWASAWRVLRGDRHGQPRRKPERLGRGPLLRFAPGVVVKGWRVSIGLEAAYGFGRLRARVVDGPP